MATPHVAGAWAILRQAVPAASVSAVLDAFETHRDADRRHARRRVPLTAPRVSIFAALGALVPVTNPAPVLASISPTRGRANTSVSLTIAGSGFDAFSVVRWNGQDRPTSLVNTHSLVASIPATDLPAAGTAAISVFNPTPGGGVTSAATFTIDPPPVLTISATPIGAGTSETVTLANGFGGPLDWMSFAQVGSPDTSYVSWTWVGAGATAFSWTIRSAVDRGHVPVPSVPRQWVRPRNDQPARRR